MLKILRYLVLIIVGILICFMVAILSCLRPRNPENTRQFCQLFRLVHPLLGVKVRPPKTDAHYPYPAVYVANHQSSLDMFLYPAFLPPRTTLIGKNSLKYIPVFGLAYWLAGNIFLDRDNHSRAWETLQKVAVIMLRKQLSIFIFPEGTRSNGDGLLPFKRGAFALAIAAQVPVVPICFSSTHKNIDLNRWRSGEVQAMCLSPISTAGLGRSDARQLADQCQQQMALAIEQLDQQVADRKASRDVV